MPGTDGAARARQRCKLEGIQCPRRGARWPLCTWWCAHVSLLSRRPCVSPSPHSTAALLPLHAVFLPVGGGGLAAGVAAVLKSVDPSIYVVGCQPATADLMSRSVAAGSAVHAAQPAGTLAEGSLPPGGRLEAEAVTLEPCRRGGAGRQSVRCCRAGTKEGLCKPQAKLGRASRVGTLASLPGCLAPARECRSHLRLPAGGLWMSGCWWRSVTSRRRCLPRCRTRACR